MPELAARLETDPDYYDAKIAGWWVWGLCCWIGGGWCSGEGPWIMRDGQLVHKKTGLSRSVGVDGSDVTIAVEEAGIDRKRPDAGCKGINTSLAGIDIRRPHLGDTGVNRSFYLGRSTGINQGIGYRRPHLTSLQGINQAPDNVGMDVRLPHTEPRLGSAEERRAFIFDWMQRLSSRLRHVRVCCGDWARIVTASPTTFHGLTGVYLDPPYDLEVRDGNCYTVDSPGLWKDVCAWCVANGSNPLLRIALSGYEGTFAPPARWTVYEWKASGGMAALGKSETRGKTNRFKERVWFSPACLGREQAVVKLF